MPDKVRLLWKKVEPYLVFDKEKFLIVLSDNAPNDIKEAYEEYGRLYNFSKELEETEEYFMNLKVELKD